MLKLSKVLLSFFVVSSFIFLNIKTVFAHPGNTASDGGHYCWTRCDYWGEVYGQRHFHGGGTYTPAEPEPDVPNEVFDPPDPEFSGSTTANTSTTASAPVINSASTGAAVKNDSCYIATAAYGSKEASDVRLLREFRSSFLEESIIGRLFVSKYYRYGPYPASLIKDNESLKLLVRETQIKPLVNIVKITRQYWD